MNSLPIIDISPYLSRTNVDVEARLATSAALHAACRTFGFFYLDISKYVSPDEPAALAELGRLFFSRPQEEKESIALRNSDGARGYARLGENVTDGKADNHEGIDFYRPVEKPEKGRPLWGVNQWPRGDELAHFQEQYEVWVEKMKALGLVVMEAMAIGLGMRPEEWEDLRAQVNDSFWVMRVIGYPPLPDDHDGFSCGAHKDYGCLTFLYADPTPSALQVFVSNPSVLGDARNTTVSDNLPAEQGSEDGVWINADPIPGCVVCNVGEMWEIWSNGLYKSTLHRVVHRGTNYRCACNRSLPFFFEPNFDAHVKPLEAALRIQEKEEQAKTSEANHKILFKKYEPIVYGDFLMEKVGNNFANDL